MRELFNITRVEIIYLMTHMQIPRALIKKFLFKSPSRKRNETKLSTCKREKINDERSHITRAL